MSYVITLVSKISKSCQLFHNLKNRIFCGTQLVMVLLSFERATISSFFPHLCVVTVCLLGMSASLFFRHIFFVFSTQNVLGTFTSVEGKYVGAEKL